MVQTRRDASSQGHSPPPRFKKGTSKRLSRIDGKVVLHINRCSALTRRRVGLSLYVRELRAGEMFVPAGYRPAQAFVRAGADGAAIRFYCGAWRSFTPAVCRSAPNRTACVSIPRGSESPFVRSHDVVRSSDFACSLWDSTFLSGDPDGVRPESLIRKGTPFCVGVPFAIDL